MKVSKVRCPNHYITLIFAPSIFALPIFGEPNVPQISHKSVEKRVRDERSKTGRASVVRGSFDLAYWGFSSPTKNFITLSYEVILYIKGRILVAE